MSTEQAPQSLDAGVVEPSRAVDAADRPFQVGDPLPLACGVPELARVYGKSLNRIRQLAAAGKFRKFELTDPADRSKRWSGVLITRYFATEPNVRTFGRRVR